MTWRRRSIILICVSAAAAVLTLGLSSWWSAQREYAYSKPAFDVWVNADPKRAQQFEQFSAAMADAGVAEVVPLWQLWRVDANYASRCDTEMFVAPPDDKWAAMVPTLRLVRDEVLPVTGPVEVVSAYRSQEVNGCIGGANRSQHLFFRALDLVTQEENDLAELFTRLCTMHNGLGAKSKMGLGAYYDLDNPARNSTGRFHIDSAGYRRWGYDYTRGSDPCPGLIS